MTVLVVTCPSCSRAASFDQLVPFRAACDGCTADLHVCIACTFYDRYVENECREPTAEYVSVKDRRNLCEEFKPRSGAAGEDDAVTAAKAKLAALFGDKPTAASSSGSASEPAKLSAADEAKAKLEALFRKK